MGLQDKLRDDLKVALRGRDACRLSIVRVLLAECKNEQIARMHALDESETVEVLKREARRRKESIEAFQAGKRPDLVAQEQATLAIINEYLPEQMSRDSLVAAAREAIAAAGASGPKDKGKVMAKLMPVVKGKADGKDVSDVVSQLLGA
jgi:uncharacterized protein YqeY